MECVPFLRSQPFSWAACAFPLRLRLRFTNLFTIGGGNIARAIVVGTAGLTGKSVRIVLELHRVCVSPSEHVHSMCETYPTVMSFPNRFAGLRCLRGCELESSESSSVSRRRFEEEAVLEKAALKRSSGR